MRSVTAQEIREVVGPVSDLVRDKQLDHVDAHARVFIAHAPLVIVASADANGRCDASPRGDPPGFVQVLDEKTLLIPDRKGNRRVDTMLNVTANPHLGLLFMVPGRADTLRVNGTGRVTTDGSLLRRCAVDGKVPQAGIVLRVEELFFHCARAFLRGEIWQPDRWPDTSELPTLGAMLRDHARITDVDAETVDAHLDASNRDLY